MRAIVSKRLLFLSTAILAVAFSACGGSGAGTTESGAGTTPSLSQAAFAKQAGAICLEERKQALAVAAELRPKKKSGFELTPGAMQKTIESALLPALESDVERIGELGAPPSAESQVQALLASMQEAVDAGRSEEAGQFWKTLPILTKQASQLGIAVCGVS
jgi:hypothetical protein